MLLPALKKTRMSAKKIQCVGNMKQLALGQSLYSQDWDAYFPNPLYEIDSSTSPWTYNDWQLAISDYIYPGKTMSNAPRNRRGSTVFWCPEKVCPSLNASRDPENESADSYRYSMNNRLPEIGNSPKKINRIKSPSSVCLCFEVFNTAAGSNGWGFANEVGNVPHNRSSNFLHVDLHVNDLQEKNIPLSNADLFWSGI
jgi:prepilin-type processing-associated H-X9-DG protein